MHQSLRPTLDNQIRCRFPLTFSNPFSHQSISLATDEQENEAFPHFQSQSFFLNTVACGHLSRATAKYLSFTPLSLFHSFNKPNPSAASLVPRPGKSREPIRSLSFFAFDFGSSNCRTRSAAWICGAESLCFERYVSFQDGRSEEGGMMPEEQDFRTCAVLGSELELEREPRIWRKRAV